jgi:hypothetical protein
MNRGQGMLEYARKGTTMRGHLILEFAILIAFILVVVIAAIVLIGPPVNRCMGCGGIYDPTPTPFQGTQVATP